jgi:hypothetical protein
MTIFITSAGERLSVLALVTKNTPGSDLFKDL